MSTGYHWGEANLSRWHIFPQRQMSFSFFVTITEEKWKKKKKKTEKKSLPGDVPQYVYDRSFWKLRNKRTYTTKETRKVSSPQPKNNNKSVWIYSVATQCLFTKPLSFQSNLGKSLLHTKIRDSTGCNNRILHEFKTDPSTKIIWNLSLLQEKKNDNNVQHVITSQFVCSVIPSEEMTTSLRRRDGVVKKLQSQTRKTS